MSKRRQKTLTLSLNEAGGAFVEAKYVPITQAAQMLGVSIDTLRRWDKRGLVSSVRPSGTTRYFAIQDVKKIIKEGAPKLSAPAATTKKAVHTKPAKARKSAVHYANAKTEAVPMQPQQINPARNNKIFLYMAGLTAVLLAVIVVLFWRLPTNVSKQQPVAGTKFGSGLSEENGTLSVDAKTIGTTNTTATNSGLEVTSEGVRILGGCKDGQILKWNATSLNWECQADGGIGTSTITNSTVGFDISLSDQSTSNSNINKLQLGPTNLSAEQFILSSPQNGQARLELGSQVALLNKDQTVTGNWSFSNISCNDCINLGSETSGDYVATITTGPGLSGGGVGEGSISALSLDVVTSGTTVTTGSNSGLEIASDGLRLIGGCSDTQLLKFNATSLAWECANDVGGTGGTITVAESDGAPVLASTSTLQFGPAVNSSDEFTVTNQGAGISRVRLGSTVLLTTNYSATLDPIYVNASESPAVGDITGSFSGGLNVGANSVALGTDTVGNYVATITSGNGISGSSATEGGTPTIALGSLTADWSQNGAFDIVLNNSNSELKILESAGGTFYGIFDIGDLTADQTFTFSQGGTVITSSNINSNAVTSVSADAGLTGGGGPGAISLAVGAGAGISVNANDIAVIYGSVANTSVQGSVSLVCPSGTGNLSGGGTNITLGTGGTCSSLNTINNPTFTTSVSTPLLTSTGAITIDGTGALTIADNITASGSLSVATTLGVTGATTLSSTLGVTGTSTLAAINASGAYTQSGSGANTFTGTSLFTSAGTGLSVTNNATVGGTLVITGTSTHTGLGTFNGGLTVETGDTFTFNTDAFTDLTGTGLTISAGALQTTLGTSVQNGEVDDDLTISSTGSVDWLALTNYPTACAAGSAVSTLADVPTCTAFAPGTSSSYIQNGTANQNTANFNIQSTGTTNVTAKFRANTSQTADIIQVRDSTDATTVFAVAPNGAVTATSFAGTHTGDGSGLTALSATQLTTGTVPTGRISGSYTGITGVGTITAGTWNGTALTDGFVSDTLTSSLFVGSGSTTTAIDLATAEVAGVLADANVADTLTIGSSSSVDWLALTNYPTACAAGSAVSTLADVPTCTAFNTDTSISLQDAYDVGNTITGTTGRNISITLADLATDQILEVTQAGTSDTFRVNDDGTFSDATPFVIDQNGNVGIGDANPAALLTVGAADAFQVNTSGAIAAATGVTSSGTITFSGLNCTTNANGGALTASALGVISCSDDDGGGSATTLQQAYGNDADGSDAIIPLTSADDSLIFRNPSSGGTDSGYIMQLDQLNSGAIDNLRLDNAGTGTFLDLSATSAGTTATAIRIRNTTTGAITTALDVSDVEIGNALSLGANTILGTTAVVDFTNLDINGDGDIRSAFTSLNGSSTANGSCAIAPCTSLVLAGGGGTNFDVGNYVKIDSTNCVSGVNSCYAKITAKATDTLTISPALMWAASSAVTEVHVPEVGGTNLTNTLTNRYGRGYFIDGVVTGNGSTTYTDGAVTSNYSSFSLLDTTVTTLNIGGAATTVTLGASGGNVTIPGTLVTGALQPSGAGALTFGNGSTTSISLATDGTGDTEVVLPTGSVSGTEILNDTVVLTTDTSGDYVASFTAGNGLTGSASGEGSTPTLAVVSANGAIVANADNIALTLISAADALSSTTSSGSGLEVLASGLTLIQGCSDTQILKWNETTDTWGCAADATGGSTTFDTIGDAAANGSIAMAEFAQSFDWNTSNVTAATFDGLTISITNDATTDINTQRGLVVKNNSATGGTTETLLVIDNADNSAVTTGLQIVGSSTGAITTAVDLSDAEIGVAIALGSNDITGSVFAVTGASGNVTSGTINSQTISSSANFTGSLSVATTLGVTGATTLNSTLAVAGTSTLAAINTSGPYTQSGVNANTFTGTSLFSSAGTGLSVTNNVTVGGMINVTGTSTFAGLVTANGGVTIEAGDTFTFNTDAFTDLTGTGLTISAGALQTTLGTSVQNGEVDDDLTISSTGSVDWLALTNYPTVCAAGSAVSTLADVPTCTAFNTDTSISLQDAYNATSGNSITTTDARDIDITLANTTTDANLDIVVATDSTGFVSLTRTDGAGTASPAQLLLLDNLDTNLAQPIGVKVQAAAGGITTAIDLSDAEIGTAIALGANDITGSVFAVTGATGNVTSGTVNGQTITSTASFSGSLSVATTLGVTGNTTLTGDVAVNGGDITSSGALNITPGGALVLGATGQNATLQGATTTISSNGANNDIILTTADQIRLTGFNCSTLTNGGALTTDASGNITCSNDDGGGAASTLQDTYGNDADGSDSIVALSASDDSIIFRNPSSVGTDSGYILMLDQLNTGAIDNLRVSNAGTGYFLDLTATSTGTTAAGIRIQNTSTGVITTAADLSDAEIVTAIALGANDVTGTNFSVAGATGNVTSGTINGQTITSTASFTGTLTATGVIRSNGGFNINGSAGVTRDCSGGGYVSGQIINNGITTTAPGCNTTGLSDQRLKKDIVELDDSILEKVKNVQTYTFNYDCSKDLFAEFGYTCDARTQTGVIAQELAELFPNLVSEDKFGYLHVDYDGLSVYNLKALLELDQKVNELSTENLAGLQGIEFRVAQLEARLNSMDTESSPNPREIDLSNLEVGALTVDLDLIVKGAMVVNGSATFKEAVRFEKDVAFDGNVAINGTATFSNNTAGLAKLTTGEQSIKVIFDKAYSSVPVVTVSLGNGKFATYSYRNVTELGFEIILKEPASEDLIFSWTAISIKDIKTAANQNP